MDNEQQHEVNSQFDSVDQNNHGQEPTPIDYDQHSLKDTNHEYQHSLKNAVQKQPTESLEQPVFSSNQLLIFNNQFNQKFLQYQIQESHIQFDESNYDSMFIFNNKFNQEIKKQQNDQDN